MPRDTKLFCSADETAKRLGVPVAWLRAQAESGALPSLKAGRRLLFNVSVVEDTLLQRSGKSGKAST